MPPDLIDRLRDQLRRDASDGDVAFLLSVVVRDPFVVYPTERHRLRRFASTAGRSHREQLLAQAAEHVLASSGNTPGRGFWRSESGPIEVVGGDAGLPPPQAVAEPKSKKG